MTPLKWLKGFFEVQAQQSMTRLLAFIAVVAAVGVAGFTCRFVWIYHEAASVGVITKSLASIVFILAVQTGVTLALRPKPVPGEQQPTPPS
jgi:hypothetical protein